MNRLTGILWVFVMVGCLTEPECLRDSRQVLEVTLMDADTKTQAPFDFTEITALDTDSTFYRDQSLSALQLSLNSTAASTTFVLKSVTRSDTLIVDYHVRVLFVSEDCGPDLLIDNLVVSKSTFDSVAITNNDLTQLSERDIEIYY